MATPAPEPDRPDAVRDYAFDTVVAGRVVTRVALVLGVALLVVLGLTVALGLGAGPVSVVAMVTGVTTLTLSHLVRRQPWVVRLDDRGYRVRFVRSAGVSAAPWRDVADVGTTRLDGEPCVVLGLRDGRRTVVPAAILSPGPEAFLADVEQRLTGRR